MTRLVTERLILRNWEERDRDLFHYINSNPQVMRYFPFRRNRAQSDELLDRFRSEISETGYGFLALELRTSGECLGFAGLAICDLKLLLPPECIEIGWRLAPEYWGCGYATEAAKALLEHGFRRLDLSIIHSFAVWNNQPSTAVMKRIGMQLQTGCDFDHPRVPATHPNLQRHVLYQITQERWKSRVSPSGR